MDIYKKLELLNQNETKIPQIKKYLIECCSQYIKYRSSGYLKNGLNVAKKFIEGRATWKQLHHYEYHLEGEAFGVEYYREEIMYFKTHPDLHMLNDLKKIRISKRLSHKEAKEYLELLSYFIVYVFSYCYRASNDLPGARYNQFLCPVLFNKYFGRLGQTNA